MTAVAADRYRQAAATALGVSYPNLAATSPVEIARAQALATLAVAEELAGQRERAVKDLAVIAGDVLITHQRDNTGGCLCGWSEIGLLHPAHQVQKLAEAGIFAQEGT